MKSPGFKALGEHQKVSNCGYSAHYEIKLSTPSVQSDTHLGCFLLSLPVEPLPGNVSDRQKGPAVEELVQDAGSLRQAGVQLFPPNLRPPSGHQTAAQGLGGRRLQAEVDHQAGTFRSRHAVILAS